MEGAAKRMRALVQRVKEASVVVDDAITGSIGHGLLVLLGVGQGDDETIARRMGDKVAGLRIFSDEQGKFNLSLQDIGGSALVVSQFTLYADTRKGKRPSFLGAAPPDQAAALVEIFGRHLEATGIPVGYGVFGAHMHVALVNDGPVTIMLDSDDWQRPRRGGAPDATV
jgi:D-aminoacyl-tRNA deacylase